MQFLEPGGLLLPIGGQFLLGWTRQQPEPFAQPDVFARQITRSWGQVVRSDRGQTVLTPSLCGQRAPVTVAIQFEPQDRRAEQTVFPQIIPHPRLDRPQVFADDHRTRPMRLQRDDADHRFVVVADVSAFGR